MKPHSNSISTDDFFRSLEESLASNVEERFFTPPKLFKSILEVIDVVGHKPEKIIGRSMDSDELFQSSLTKNIAY